MALTYSQANAVSTKHFNFGKMAEQVYDENIIFDRIYKGNRQVIKGGTSILHSLRYKELGDAKMVSPTDARVTTSYSTRTQLELAWKYVTVDAMINWQERNENMGEHQIVDLLKDKYKEATQDLAELMSDKFFLAYASKGAEDFDGIYTIVQDPSSTSTYAGIASGDASSWAAGMYDTSTTTLALWGSASLDYGLRSCYFRGFPDLIVTTLAISSIYASKLYPGERRSPEEGRAGATDLYFRKVPLIADTHVPAGDVVYFNTKNLWFYVHPNDNFSDEPWESHPDYIKAIRKLITVQGNYIADVRKVFGAYTGITS